jgi:hypothetical protein
MRKSILFCILVHDSPRQTMRLLRAIYNTTDHFVIHVDQSAHPAYKNVLQAVRDAFPRIHVISNHICTWGGYSLVAAEIDMIRTGLELHGGWTHAMFLSGTHLPVWPMAMIRGWLVEGLSFMTWDEIPRTTERPERAWTAGIWDRFNWYYDEVTGVGLRQGELAGPPPFLYAKGEQWVVLARNHAEYAVRPGLDPVRQRLARTAVPDEAFFQSVLLNSDYRDRIRQEKTTVAIWGDGGGHPRVLDLPGYINYGKGAGAPFIRKIAEILGDEAEVERAINRMIGPVEVPGFRQSVYNHYFRK